MNCSFTMGFSNDIRFYLISGLLSWKDMTLLHKVKHFSYVYINECICSVQYRSALPKLFSTNIYPLKFIPFKFKVYLKTLFSNNNDIFYILYIYILFFILFFTVLPYINFFMLFGVHSNLVKTLKQYKFNKSFYFSTFLTL